MFHIVGVAHPIQHNEKEVPGEVVTEFTEFLEEYVRANGISVLAEESSREAIERSNTRRADNRTELEVLAEEIKNSRHIFVDPDSRESQKLGIWRRERILRDLEIVNRELTHTEFFEVNVRMAPHDQERERYWLKTLETFLKEEVLFVCGYYHCASFKILLRENGIESRIIKIFT